MTDPMRTAVEILARALAEEYFKGRNDDPEDVQTAYVWANMNDLHKNGWRDQARELLAKIAPSIRAEEREACAKVADAEAHEECDVAEQIAAAVRQRGNE